MHFWVVNVISARLFLFGNFQMFNETVFQVELKYFVQVSKDTKAREQAAVRGGRCVTGIVTFFSLYLLNTGIVTFFPGIFLNTSKVTHSYYFCPGIFKHMYCHIIFWVFLNVSISVFTGGNNWWRTCTGCPASQS